MEFKSKHKKAKCPHCKSVHSFTEIIFQAINDQGIWEIECQNCQKHFYLNICNPRESTLYPNYLIKERLDHDKQDFKPEFEFSSDIVEYDFDLNELNLKYQYNSLPLYICKFNECNLETIAREMLNNELSAIRQAYWVAVNYCLANRCPESEYLVINLDIECQCGEKHTAVYYCKFLLNGRIQEDIDDYLLAHITNSSIEDIVDGLFSKSEIMSFLEKLVIRWNLLYDQIIIASPFIGHQYLSKEDKLATWNWLLSMLDAKKVIFITRQQAMQGYKSVLEDIEGLNYDFLQEYGLENKIISANVKKNDFHAKFFAGVSRKHVEVMSGSANLVSGPSIENITFKGYKYETFFSKYLQKLNLQIPSVNTGNHHYIMIEKCSLKWSAKDSSILKYVDE